MLTATEATNPLTSAPSGALDFSQATVQIYGPQAGTLAIMRDALRNEGFRKVTVHTKVKQLTDGLTTTPADLVLVDIDHTSAETCKVVRDIRFRRVGQNPFVGVIAVSSGIQQQQAPVVLNSGLDDVLLIPASANAVRSRLTRLVQARKPFVGTPTYVGPDRRAPDRQLENDIPLVDVPNLLRTRVLREWDDPIESSVERTYRAIGAQQVGRMGVAIRTVAAELSDRPVAWGEEEVRTRLTKLSADLAELTDHMRDQAYDDLASMLDLTKVALIATIDSEVLTPKRLEVLRLHGDSLLATLRTNGAGQEKLETGLQRAVASVRKPREFNRRDGDGISEVPALMDA